MFDKKNIFNKPYLIAEIGINHNGSVKLAKRLIDLSKQNNFDCVKFQKRDPEVCVPNDQKEKLRETPWGTMTYIKYKKRIEFNYKQMLELKKYATKKGIDFFTSCFDINSFNLIRKLKLKYNKIPSAMITNIKFLDEVAKQRKKTFISTGMCKMSDITKAINIFKKHKCKFVLMHCVSLYPCPEEKLNLRMIATLKRKFKCEVGYSGHEASVSPSIFAFMLGATVIERHVTLDRSMWGTDQAASLSPEGMKMLSSVLLKSNKIFGNGIKNYSTKERAMLKKFKYW